MADIRVGIAGFGIAARCHIKALSGIRGFEIVAVCTARPNEAGADILSQCGDGTSIFSDYNEMLANANLDMVSICTFHHLHVEQIIEAARRGIHIVLEKPLCINPSDLRHVQNAVVSSGIKMCVCFQEFHFGQFLTALEVVEAGLIGDVHLAEIEYYNCLAPWAPQAWWITTRKKGGSSLLSGGCHGLHFMMLAMGNATIEEVTSYSTQSRSPHFAHLEYPGSQVSIFKFDDGRVGKLSAVADSLQPYLFRYSLLGSEGTLVDLKLNTRKFKGLDPSMWTTLGAKDLSDGADIGGYMFVNMFKNFRDHILDDAELRYTDFDTVFKMHQVMFAADHSARVGKPVRLDDYVATIL